MPCKRSARLRLNIVLVGAISLFGAFAPINLSFASTFTALHCWTANGPGAPLIEATDGNFYGTTTKGGGNGSVFSISPTGDFKTIYTFTGGADAGQPSGLIQASDGNFYGTTKGSTTTKYGTVFQLTPAGVLTTLHTFSGGPSGVVGSRVALVQGSDGMLYGVAYAANVADKLYDLAKVFRIKTDGGGFKILADFSQYGPSIPASQLIQGSDGNFYGALTPIGLVYQMTSAGALTTIRQFEGDVNGGRPSGPLLQASNGLLYGSTMAAGANHLGTLFDVSTTGMFTNLGSFSDAINLPGFPGAIPNGGLIADGYGNLYGTTAQGGAFRLGSLFEVAQDGTGFTELMSFPSSNSAETFGPTLGSDGSFYGATNFEVWKFTR